MKKTLAFTCLAILFCAASGCSKRAQVPEKTIIAAYVDIEKAHKNGLSFSKAVIAALPNELRLKAKVEHEEFLQEINGLMKTLNPKWIVIAYGGTLRELSEVAASPAKGLSFAIKIDASNDDAAKALRKLARWDMKSTTTDDGEVYESDAECCGRIDGDYLIFGASPAAFTSMYDLYRKSGGKGKTKPSAEFDNLTSLPGNAIARISTAPISSLIKRFELTKSVADLGERCKDKRLADLILGMGTVTIEIKAGKEALTTSMRVACESATDAKIVNGFFQTLAFTSHAGCDIASYLAKDPAFVRGCAEKTHLPESTVSNLFQQADALHNGTQDIDAGQNGKVAEISMSLTPDNPLMSMYAVPFLMKFRNDARAATCFANMQQLKSAAEAHLKQHPGETPSLDAICGPEETKPLKAEPRCPLGGHYQITLKDGAIDVVCPYAEKGHKFADTVPTAP